MVTFVDRVVLHATGGDGGHGCASIHREKFKPLAGPDGGNGGNGGSVIIAVDPQVTTLLDYHHSPHRHAPSGTQGMGDHRSGSTGADLVLGVPDGTVVKAPDGTVLADLVGVGAEYVAAAGGRGGLGNAALASQRRKAPGFALLGEPGNEQDIVLELKTIADVALVGYPSAGKSSLVAAISAARPKIADYPFTTLVPNLGVVQAGGARYTVADVPGLIPGASEGRGLGLEFLRHIERCAVIVHVLDCATLEPGPRPALRPRGHRGRAARPTPATSRIEGGRVPLAGAAADRRAQQDRRPRGARAGRAGQARPRGPRVPRVRDLDRQPRGPAPADVRARGDRRQGPSRRAGAGEHPRRAAPEGRGRRRVHGDAPRGRGPGRVLLGARREARALGAADRLLQRRGRRLPGRPAGAPGRRGAAVRRGCRRRRRGARSAASTTRSCSTGSPRS